MANRKLLLQSIALALLTSNVQTPTSGMEKSTKTNITQDAISNAKEQLKKLSKDFEKDKKDKKLNLEKVIDYAGNFCKNMKVLTGSEEICKTQYLEKDYFRDYKLVTLLTFEILKQGTSYELDEDETDEQGDYAKMFSNDYLKLLNETIIKLRDVMKKPISLPQGNKNNAKPESFLFGYLPLLTQIANYTKYNKQLIQRDTELHKETNPWLTFSDLRKGINDYYRNVIKNLIPNSYKTLCHYNYI